jgi:hypothetical protein
MIYDETIDEYGFDPQKPVPVLEELRAYLKEPSQDAEPVAATAYDQLQLPRMLVVGEELVKLPEQPADSQQPVDPASGLLGDTSDADQQDVQDPESKEGKDE